MIVSLAGSSSICIYIYINTNDGFFRGQDGKDVLITNIVTRRIRKKSVWEVSAERKLGFRITVI